MINEKDNNSMSAAMLVFAYATEMLMREWLKANNWSLQGESKMLFSGMQQGVQKALHYYERLTEKYAGVVFKMDKGCTRLDEMRSDSAAIVRLYLEYLNMDANGYPIENIEAAIGRLLEKEENPKIIVSDEVINKFRIQ